MPEKGIIKPRDLGCGLFYFACGPSNRYPDLWSESYKRFRQGHPDLRIVAVFPAEERVDGLGGCCGTIAMFVETEQR